MTWMYLNMSLDTMLSPSRNLTVLRLLLTSRLVVVSFKPLGKFQPKNCGCTHHSWWLPSTFPIKQVGLSIQKFTPNSHMATFFWMRPTVVEQATPENAGSEKPGKNHIVVNSWCRRFSWYFSSGSIISILLIPNHSSPARGSLEVSFDSETEWIGKYVVYVLGW